MLHAHAARAHQIERVEIDLLVAAHLARVGLGGLGRAGGGGGGGHAAGASDGKGGSAQASAESYRQAQSLAQAIKRQPLAASFVRGNDRFGWVLGPKYEITGGKPSFVQATSRYTFTASVAVPGWFSQIKLKGCGHWVEADGRPSAEFALFGSNETDPAGCSREVVVRLPHSHRAVFHALMDSSFDLFADPEIYLLLDADDKTATPPGANSRSISRRLRKAWVLWHRPAAACASVGAVAAGRRRAAHCQGPEKAARAGAAQRRCAGGQRTVGAPATGRQQPRADRRCVAASGGALAGRLQTATRHRSTQRPSRSNKPSTTSASSPSTSAPCTT